MSTQPASTVNLEVLLRSGEAAARSGNTAAARALFSALSREHPDDVRVWLGLADAAADPAEQRAALDRALELDPGNERAVRALTLLAAPDTTPAGVLPPPRADEPVPPSASPHLDEAEAPRSPFPMLNLLAFLLILALLAALGVVIGRNLLSPGQLASATATPALVVVPGPDIQPTLPLVAPTAAPAVTAPGAAPTAAPPPTAAATQGAPTAPAATQGAPTAPAATPPAATAPPDVTVPAATAPPAPTASSELPLGQLLDYDGWSATLLRPDYAVLLDGAIGDLQPSGRFVLAVIAVSNNSPAPRTLPADLFTLVDSAGRSFLPAPGASTAYLALYGRGQRGDLAFEDAVDPASGMRSVPLLFDVPPDASGLRLTMAGSAGAGWPIGGGSPQPVGP